MNGLLSVVYMKMGKKVQIYFGCEECKFNLTREYSLQDEPIKKSKKYPLIPSPCLFSLNISKNALCQWLHPINNNSNLKV